MAATHAEYCHLLHTFKFQKILQIGFLFSFMEDLKGSIGASVICSIFKPSTVPHKDVTLAHSRNHNIINQAKQLPGKTQKLSMDQILEKVPNF